MFAQQISYYKLIKQIGAGGMGEVYLAEDTRLNRKVALKLLPENLSKDRKQLSRFLREASLAANLNHPNICIIYEVNDSAERPFIAMEYVEGETLFDKIQSRTLIFGEIIEIAVQIADALDDAHRQGIIHRDIKSANIIINQRGMVKILDFGLAKTLVENVSDEAVTRAKTEAGILVGTIRYMSPEQSLGKALDGRTDLWSLGVLLYEMISGESPFKGETQVAIFDEILHKNPAPLTDFDEDIPVEFEQIIYKLLEKVSDFRYQTASDLRADLKRLQRSTGEYATPAVRIHTTSEKTISPQTGFIKVQTEELANQKTADLTLQGRRTKNYNFWLIGALAAVFLVMISVGAYKFSQGTASAVPFEKREMQRLTALGTVWDAVISADGKYLVYVQDEGEFQSLWVKQIATGSSVQIVPSASVVYQGINISKDGSWIYYNIWDRKSVGQIFRVPMLGGTPQKVVHDAMPTVEISPDNRQLAFIRSYDKERKQDLIIVDVENFDKQRSLASSEKVLASSGWNSGIYAFTWSPDSQSLAVIVNRPNEENAVVNFVVEMFLDGRPEKVIWEIPSRVKDIRGGIIWKPDKSGILTTISENQDPYSQIWQISYPDGQALRLTRDINSYGRLSATSDGKNLVSVQNEMSLGLWVMDVDKPEQLKKITDGKQEGWNFSWMPDGRILYTSAIGGNVDIWISDANGANKKQITSDPFIEGSPCITSDGKTIAYSSNRNNGYWNLWVMNADGTNQRKLLQNGVQWGVYCSKLTNDIFYSGTADNSDSPSITEGLWEISLENSLPKFIWNKSPFQVEISPDEKNLVYTIWNEEKKMMEQNIYSLETGKIQILELPPTASGGNNKEPHPKWTPDGRAISFLNEEKLITNIWTKSLRDGKLKKISNFNESKVFDYSWSADGKKILILRGSVSRDALMIKENN